jgi:hypothetical protein
MKYVTIVGLLVSGLWIHPVNAQSPSQEMTIPSGFQTRF